MNRFELINAIVDDATLTSTQKMILVALWRFSDKNGMSYPSVSKIMSSAGIANQRTYYKNRDKLIELGWVKVEQIKGKGCIYNIEVPTKSQILQNNTVPTSNIADADTGNTIEQTEQLTKQKTENILKYIHSESNPYLSYISGGYLYEELSSELIH